MIMPNNKTLFILVMTLCIGIMISSFVIATNSDIETTSINLSSTDVLTNDTNSSLFLRSSLKNNVWLPDGLSSDNLTLYLKFDDGSNASNFYDYSGNNNNATQTDPSAYPTLSIGYNQSGQSIYTTDGLYDSFGMNNIPLGSHPRTVMVWINATSTDTTQSIVDWGVSSSGQRFNMYYDGTNIYAEFGGIATGATYPVEYLNQWHNVALVLPEGKTSTADVEIFIDGVNQTTTTAGGSTTVNTANSTGRVGGSPSLPSSYSFKGGIDNVLIFNKGLSQSEITSIVANDFVVSKKYVNVFNVTNWIVNGMSYASLNLPFEGGSSSTFTKDYSNNGFNATGINSTVFNDTTNLPTWGSTIGYQGSGGFFFDGTNYLEIPYHFALNSNAISFGAWVKDEGNHGSFRTILASRDVNVSSNNSGYYLQSTNQDYVECWIATGWSGIWTVLRGPKINSTGWNRVDCVIHDNTSAEFYVNGALVDSSSYTQYVPNAEKPFRIGAGTTEGTAYNFWNGTIDDVRVYPRALSAEQVYQDYVNSSQNVIVSNELTNNDVWAACITPTYSEGEGIGLCSNNVTILNQASNEPVTITLDSPVNMTETTTFLHTFLWKFNSQYQERTTCNVTFTPENDSTYLIGTNIDSVSNDFAGITQLFFPSDYGVDAWQVICADDHNNNKTYSDVYYLSIQQGVNPGSPPPVFPPANILSFNFTSSSGNNAFNDNYTASWAMNMTNKVYKAKLDPSVLAFYTFENNDSGINTSSITDYSRLGNNLVRQSKYSTWSAEASSWNAGSYHVGIDYDVNTTTPFRTVSTSNWGSSDGLSYCFWLNNSGMPAVGTEGLLYKPSVFYVRQYPTSQVVTLYNSTGSVGAVTAINSPKFGQWHQYCYANRMRPWPVNASVDVYIDGVLNQSLVMALSDNTSKTYAYNVVTVVGYDGQGGAGRQLNGSINDILIFNRTISSTDVSNLYNMTMTKYAAAEIDFAKVNSGEITLFNDPMDAGSNQTLSKDFSLLSANLTVMGGATWYPNKGPTSNGAYYFNSTVGGRLIANQSVSTASYWKMNRTIMFWYNPENTGGNTNILFSTSQSSADYIGQGGSGSQLMISWTNSTGGQQVNYSSPGLIKTNSWNHYTITQTVDGSNTVSFAVYVNGIINYSTSSSMGYTSTLIGNTPSICSFASTARCNSAWMSRFKVFNGSLSSQQILQTYNDEASGSYQKTLVSQQVVPGDLLQAAVYSSNGTIINENISSQLLVSQPIRQLINLSSPVNNTNVSGLTKAFNWSYVAEFSNTTCNGTFDPASGANITLFTNAFTTNNTVTSANYTFTTAQDGMGKWNVQCADSFQNGILYSGDYNLKLDNSAPVVSGIGLSQPTSTTFVFTATIVDAQNAVINPVVWVGNPTANVGYNMTSIGSNGYTATVSLAAGNYVYHFSASDTVGNSVVTSDTSTIAGAGCGNVKNILFAGFALLSLLGIVGAAWLLINANMFDDGISITIAVIVTAIVVMVGYVLVTTIGASVC